MNTSDNSQLPEYGAKLFHIQEPAGSYDMLEVRCPRAGCRGTFWVKPGAWQRRTGVQTAACPYCFRASWLPGKRDAPSVSAVREQLRRRKRIVKR